MEISQLNTDAYYLYAAEFEGKRNPEAVTNPALPSKKDYHEKKVAITKLEGEVRLPKEKKRNRYIDVVEEKLEDWLLKIKLIKQEQLKKIQTFKFASLFSTALNDQNTSDHLFTQSKWVAWLFIFDDIIDKDLPKLHEDKVDIPLILEIFENIMQQKEDNEKLERAKLHKFPNLEAFITGFRNISKEFNAINIEPAHKRYFLKNLKQYFESIKIECQNREKKESPSQYSYFEVRKHTGAVKLTFSFIAALKNIPLTKDITESLLFQQLENAAVDALSLMNDIVSFPKESRQLSDEDAHENLIYIHEKKSKKGNASQDGVAQSFEAHNKRMKDFYFALEQIRKDKRLTPEQKKAMLAYADVMESCMYDNAYWSVHETTRYTKFQDKKGKEHFVPMILQKMSNLQLSWMKSNKNLDVKQEENRIQLKAKT